MSPRVKLIRKVLNPPVITGFKPYGPESANNNQETVFLLYEEYEALRLCDYDNYNHHNASVIMGISRPTFTRIYSSTRRKIAKAFVEGRQISIEGGKVYFDSDWYHCQNCNCYFNNPEREKELENCPLCNSLFFTGYDYDNTINEQDTEQNSDYCICPGCGFEQQHQKGMPCSREVCPKCNTFMKRKGIHNCRTLKTQIV